MAQGDTLKTVLDRVRAYANVNSSRLPDARLIELVGDAQEEILDSSRIRFAERSIDVQIQDGVDTYLIQDGVGFMVKPVLWTYSNTANNTVVEIKQVLIEGFRVLLQEQQFAADTGKPSRYTIWGQSNDVPVVKVWPTPTVDLETTFDCRVRLFRITDPTLTNDLIQFGQDALTYLTLVLASPYLEDDARVEQWNSSFQRAYGRMLRSHAAARYSGSARRSQKEPG